MLLNKRPVTEQEVLSFMTMQKNTKFQSPWGNLKTQISIEFQKSVLQNHNERKGMLTSSLCYMGIAYSRVRNRRRAGNKGRAWKIWQKE